MKELSCPQMSVLWHLKEGWKLHEVHKVDNTIHWRLCWPNKYDGSEPVIPSIRVRATTINNLIERGFIESDMEIHNRCYRIWTLTEKGAERAKIIMRMDFE